MIKNLQKKMPSGLRRTVVLGLIGTLFVATSTLAQDTNATTMKPAEAKEAGLVDRLFPDAAACRAGAMEYAARLGDGPSAAIGHAKLVATLGYGGPIDLGLALEREAIGRIFVSDDADEGIKAFTEKRKAQFKGH